MLNITRRVGEGVRIGEAHLIVREIRERRVVLEFDAPLRIPIYRDELVAEMADPDWEQIDPDVKDLKF